MKAEPEKNKAVEMAMGQIEKQFGKGAIMRLGSEALTADVPVISTGSLSLDIATGIGGIPRGRVIEIYGPESSGKTTLALHTIAEAQKKGGLAAFIDAEHALDVVYANKLGSTATSSWFPSRTPASRPWKSLKSWCGAAPWTWWWWTRWPPWSPERKLRGKWGTPTWVFRPASCLRPCAN